MKKRILSMLLVVCMVFTLFPTAAFATEGGIPVGTSNTGDNVTIDSGTPAVCPHEHDGTCGYINAVEGSPCTHLNEDGSYSCAPLVSGNEASPSDAEYVCNHSDSCGYIEAVAGSLCTHECELCSTQGVPPVGEDSILPPAKECDCTVQCTAADAENEIEAVIKADCPVCGIANADLTAVCKGEAPALLKAPRAGENSWNIGAPTATDIKATLSPDGTTLTITGSGAMMDWAAESDVPWYKIRGTITTVTIEAGITNIGAFAFNECDVLTSITIPASVSTIGGYAFNMCALLKSVTFAENSQLTTIGNSAFSNCDKLTSITIPESVTTIGHSAFHSCSSLTSITIPEDVTAIGNSAFYGCKALESITIPEGVTTIGNSAFYGCKALESITIPEDVTAIGNSAFNGCRALESVTFNRTTAPTLGYTVFDSTHADLKIYIPAGSTDYIGETASPEWTALKDNIVTPVTLKVNSGTENDDAARAEDAIYKTVGGAIAKAESGDTIQLQTDITENVSTPVDAKNYTIDLNGKTLSGGAGVTITHMGDGTLTIMDSVIGGKVESTGTTTSDIVTITNAQKGTITINSGTISANNTVHRAFGIVCLYTGSLNIGDNAKITVSGGAGAGAIAIDSYGKTVIGGNASVTSTDDAVYNRGGTLNISGGEISSTGVTRGTAVTTLNGGATTLTGGAISATRFAINTNKGTFSIPSGSPVIKGGDYAMNKAPNLTGYTNVKVTASMNVSGTPVVAYDAEQITRYKYLTFGTDVPPTVTGVTVTPTTATVQKGTTKQFSAVVEGTGSPAQTVIWAVEGGMDAITETSISPSGLLTVVEGETAKTLTIIATSTADPTKSGTATVTVTTEPVTTYTVTFNANGGSVSPASATTAADGKLATLPIPTRSGSYRFDGWFTAASGGTEVTTATVFDVNTTIYARWTYTGGGGGGSDGGGSSSGGGSNVIVTPPAPDQPNDPTKAEIKIDTKVDGKGGATVSITDKNITDAIEKGAAEAKKNGDEANGITLVLRADTGNKTVNTVTVNLPKTVQEKIISNKIVSTVVVVDNPNIKIGMDLNAITAINQQAKADVNLTATKLDSGKLTGEAKTAIGTRPVFDLGVSYGSGKSVENFGGGSVTVSIPYTLQSGEKAGNVHGVYVDANGKAQWITNSSYDAVAKVLRFSTNHFSTYGVGYKADVPAFTDIASHWAKNDIEFVVARGLLSGIEDSVNNSGTTFSPNTAMTRGMFVTALGRLAKIDTNSYKSGSFTDVKADAYYAPYVNWAASKGITTGTTATTFAPDQTVTR